MTSYIVLHQDFEWLFLGANVSPVKACFTVEYGSYKIKPQLASQCCPNDSVCPDAII